MLSKHLISERNMDGWVDGWMDGWMGGGGGWVNDGWVMVASSFTCVLSLDLHECPME